MDQRDEGSARRAIGRPRLSTPDKKGENSRSPRSSERNGVYLDQNNSATEEPNRSTRSEVRRLSFRQPGKQMEDIVPQMSKRELRKVNRKIYTENIKRNQLYDESGVSLENSMDLCDCLDAHCPGCHFPCPKCGSEKCGTECRCSRKWTYDQVQVEGTSIILKWPS